MRESFVYMSTSIRRRLATFEIFLLILLCLSASRFFSTCVFAQELKEGATWREADEDRANISDVKNESGVTNGAFPGPNNTRYSLELSQLPNSDGQFWVVYDLAPYTERFPNVTDPQNSILDWILTDSGEDFWRKEPFSVLSGSRERLYVYHCAKVQQYVSNVVDRFLDPEKKDASFSIRVVALQGVDWRARLEHLPTVLPTTVSGSTADVQSRLVERAELEKIFADCQKRAGFNFVNAGRDVVKNGATFGWAAASPKKSFVAEYRVDPRQPSGYVADSRTIDEGFRIETTPLLSTTGETLELTFRFRSTVVEKTKAYSVKIPTEPRLQLTAERPVVLSSDFRGKVAFARSKAAIVDLGVVPLPIPKKNASSDLIDNLSEIVGAKTAFCNVLIFIEERIDAK